MDIIDKLKDFCEAKNIKFLAGSNFYQNYKLNKLAYENGDLIMAADFNVQLIRGKGNAVEAYRYNGYIALGRKFDDDGSRANLNETFEEKYNQRLKILIYKLSLLIIEFACIGELSIENEEYSNELNKFDTMIDFVVCKLTLEE